MKSTVGDTLLIFVGVLSTMGSVLNWRFLSRGKLFNFLLGETVSRIIYFVAGVLLFSMGFGRSIGANWLTV